MPLYFFNLFFNPQNQAIQAVLLVTYIVESTIFEITKSTKRIIGDKYYIIIVL
jgi:hypothetical protein